MTTLPQANILLLLSGIIIVGCASVALNDFIERRAPLIRRWWRLRVRGLAQWRRQETK